MVPATLCLSFRGGCEKARTRRMSRQGAMQCTSPLHGKLRQGSLWLLTRESWPARSVPCRYRGKAEALQHGLLALLDTTTPSEIRYACASKSVLLTIYTSVKKYLIDTI